MNIRNMIGPDHETREHNGAKPDLKSLASEKRLKTHY